MYGHFIKSCKQVYYFCRKSHCKSYVIHVEIMGWERGRGDKKIKKHGEKIREENKLSWITARILRHKIKTLWYLNLTTHRAIYFYQNIEIYSSLTKLEWVECKIFETLPIDVENKDGCQELYRLLECVVRKKKQGASPTLQHSLTTSDPIHCPWGLNWNGTPKNTNLAMALWLLKIKISQLTHSYNFLKTGCKNIYIFKTN